MNKNSRLVCETWGRPLQKAAITAASCLVCLAATCPAIASPFDATPDDNLAVAATMGSLTGAHVASVVGGIVAPGFFGTGFELAALGTDVALKNTPPIMEIPDSFSRFPNAVATGDMSGQQCVYRFGNSIRSDSYTGGIEEGFAATFYVPYDPLDPVFADLGTPAVYHTHADVRVRAKNAYLGAGGYAGHENSELKQLQQRPEFPPGHHAIDWEAQSSMNYIMDVAVPGALIPVSIAAEGYLARKVASTSRRAVIDFSAGVATELGLVAVDVTGVAARNKWYEDTTVYTAANRATQQLTVWDTSRPYYLDTGTHATSITQQTIELEATDFGGVRLGRVEEELRAKFEAIDPCGKAFTITSDSPATRLFTIGDGPHDLVWEAREIDGGPYQSGFTLSGNQAREGERLVTRLTQHITVVDTQAPILVAPSGFARYDEDGINLSLGDFPLGRARVVDLADPSPTVTNDAPTILPGPPDDADGVRYDITWDATDDAGNSALAQSDNPAAFVQTITLKHPGRNTAPRAVAANASTISARTVDIRLEGVDTDDIGGRVDPLDFEIEDYPVNGQFDAPLYPYFIEDFRLTPVGEREEGDNTTRVSPLGALAEVFAGTAPAQHGTFLNNQICNAAPGSANDIEFGGVIPVNMVYEPGYVHVSDDGYYYIRDKYYVCGETPKLSLDTRASLSPIPRLSKWTNNGELVAMTPLYVTDDPNDNDSFLNSNQWPGDRFSVDHNDRLWVTWSPIYSTFGRTAIHYSFNANLEDVQFHGSVSYNEQDAILGEGVRDVGSDGNTNLLFELNRTRLDVRDLSQVISFGNDVGQVGQLDASKIEAAASGGGLGGLGGGSTIGTDLRVDRDGNVYVLDPQRNRIHKWAATTSDGAGGWSFGAYIGWMGSCTGNKTIDGTPTGVPYNSCDVSTGTSRGYACSDEKCTRAATDAGTAGPGHGQFDAPASMEIDPRNILYVADTDNLRVQRFGQDGSFAGEAKSTGTGVNQGEAPGFILGNMGKPRYLSVNSSSFFVMEPDAPNGDSFVHVFKTLPFRDVTPDGATVRYVSDYNYQGSDSFTYTVDDGIDKSAPATVDVTVTRAFRPPEKLRSQCFADDTLATEIACALEEDSTIYVRLSADDPDGFLSDFPNGLDELTFELIDEPRHGTLTLDDPSFEQDNAITYRYTPAANYHGEDTLRFHAYDGDKYSEDDATLTLTVTAIPDPVVVEFDDDIRAARGFPSMVKADFSDVDEEPDQQATLVTFDWGDGTTATTANWTGSGREDLNGREISPQVDFGRGRGMLIGSHDYANTGVRTVTAVMNHAAVEGLAPVQYQASVQVLDVTVVGARLAAPMESVSPDAPFPLVLTVQNVKPSSWNGLVAEDAAIAFDVPPGLQVVNTDPRCSGTTRVTCVLGALAADQSTDIVLGGLVPLAAARERADYPLLVDIIDAGPKLTDMNTVVLSIEIADSDGDGTIDVDDAYADDARYQQDTDGDGLADNWERDHGLDPDVADDTSADVDGDGYTLLEEFVNGSYPFLAEREDNAAGDRLVSPDNAVQDRFGLAMAGGDFNDDGYADLLIGATTYKANGAVFISWGTANGATTALDTLLPSAGAAFGRAVAAGDWDDNGYDDIAIAGSTAVYIHWNNGQVLDQPDLVLPLLNGGTLSALQLLSGDLDDDGVDDLLINAATSAISSQIDLYLHAAGGLDAAPQTFTPPGYGFQALALGDVDGDDATDLLGGLPDENTVVGYLAADNDWTAVSGLNESFAITGPAGQSQFGWALASGGDATGDGIDDLVVGAYTGGGYVNLYSSESAYYTGNAAPPSQVIAGEPTDSGNNGLYGDQLGVSLAIGHLDSDGYADLVIGANRAGPEDEGQVRILHGSAAGFAGAQIENGTTSFDLLGHNVAIPGDMDGDGIDDVAGGASDVLSAQNTSPDGGYVQMYYHRYAALDAADDEDSDGVATAFDNCPADANTNQADLDDDGDGDACDTDVDGDGLDNTADNCPLLASLDQTDSDGDLDGDLCDDDDDNDDVADADDAFPLDPAYSSDSDSDGLPDEYETAYGLDPDDAADGTADLDGDGRNNRDEYEAGTNIAADDVSPAVSAPADIVVDSTGPHTPVALPATGAIDVKDGPLTATPSPAGPFRPGRNVVTWTALDAAGNAGIAQQRIDVIPQVGFVGDTLLAAEDMQADILVALNGDAVSYPVTVSYTLGGTASEGGDYQLAAGDIVIDNSNIAAIGLTTLADGADEGEETLTLTLDTPDNAVLGSARTYTVRIVDGNLPPRPHLSIEQDGRRVTTVTSEGPPVTVTVDAADPNAADSHTYDWSRSDALLLPQEGYNQSTFTFDPAGLDGGVYRVEADVTDSGSPAATARRYRYVRVVVSTPPFPADVDSDGDGMADADEGLRDSNDNGASDYLDPAFVAHHLPAHTGSASLLQVPDGYQLALGRVALASGDDAMVSMMDVVDYGNFGLPAGDGDDADYSYPGGLFDFEVSDLPAPAHIATVVIPQMAAIPADATYRKYDTVSGWHEFVSNAANTVSSAPGVPGYCPAPGSDAYTPGLNAGDYCVQLRIQDNGPNDADLGAGRVVRDPGGVAVLAEAAAVGAAAVSVPDKSVTTGQDDVVMLRFTLNSNSSDVVLNALTLAAGGSGNDASDVTNVSLWLDVNGDGAIDAGDSEIGSGRYAGNNGSLTLQMATPYTLDAGQTAFIVSYDF